MNTKPTNGRRYDRLIGPLVRKVHVPGLALAAPAAGIAVLEIGCGTAVQLRRYAGEGRNLCGIDHDPGMLARARENLGQDALVARADVGKLPFEDGCFDLVLTSLVLHELPPALRPRLLKEAHRVLRPGGRILLIDFSVGPTTAVRGRFSRALIRMVEWSAGGDHYRGFKHFKANGGLPALIDATEFAPVRELLLGGGALELRLLEK